MSQFRNSAILLAALVATSCTSVSSTDSPASAARSINAQSQASLGVSIRSLAFLFEAGPGTYLAKDSVSLQESWEHLAQLERAGYVKVNTIPSAQGDLVEIVLTAKGQEVAGALQGP